MKEGKPRGRLVKRASGERKQNSCRHWAVEQNKTKTSGS